MPIKMIVTDLDGTLLRSDKTISEYTSLIFKRCIDKGIKIAIATARPIRAVKCLNLPISFDASIYHNGAFVNNGHENILQYGISPQAIEIIVSATLQNDSKARICVEIDDKIYGNADASDIWAGIEMNMTDFTDLPLMPADKAILLTADKHKLESVLKVLPEDLYLETSENTIAMIMNKNATKINAIKQLCHFYNILINDVAAFGDDHNDVEMLHECGVGVAVTNAISEAKIAANFICDTNDNDGIAKWIEKNVL